MKFKKKLKNYVEKQYCILHTIKYAVNPFPILKYCISFVVLQAEK
jgi:hypothetical protein